MKIPKVNIEASAVIPIAELYVKIQRVSKELAINKGKKMYESDINPISTVQVKIIPPKMPKLNIAFFDIETDFDPERGFAGFSELMSTIAITVHLQWLDALVTFAVPPRH